MQQRLKNRWFYVPEIALADYTVEAKVDWVEFRVRLGRNSQARHVGETLRSMRASVYAYDRSEEDRSPAEGPMNTDTFWVRIQDPSPWCIGLAKGVLQEAWSIVDEIRIAAVEVAIDWNPTDNSDPKRYQMLATLFRHHLPLPFDHELAQDDLRQVYGPNVVQYVVPSIRGQSRTHPDTDVGRSEVQTRLLRDSTFFEHYLDATVYRGARLAPRLFKILRQIYGQQKSLDGNQDAPTTSREMRAHRGNAQRAGLGGPRPQRFSGPSRLQVRRPE